jgi:uncharacterized membrane protein
MLGEVEVCFGVQRVQNARGRLLVLFSRAAGWLLFGLALWRCWLDGRQRHIEAHVLGVEHEVLLEMHVLLLVLIFLMLGHLGLL